LNSNTGEKVSNHDTAYELNYPSEQPEPPVQDQPQPQPTAKHSQRDAKESICVDFSDRPESDSKPNYIKLKKKVTKPPLQKQRSLHQSEKASFGPQNSSQVYQEGLNSTRSMRLHKKSTISEN
jgi:hypothetical protein